MDLLSIGRFARLTGLTVRAVRHYGELGLLPPAYVDDETGYRYYAPGQLADAEAIKRLRSLDLGLDEVGEILAASDPSLARERLIRHRARMERVALTARRILDDLERLIEGKEPLVSEPADAVYEFEVKEFADQPVLAIRDRVPLEELKHVIPAHYKELFGYLDDIGEKAVEPWAITVCPFPDEDGLVAIEDNVVVESPLPGRGRVESGTLPACIAVCTIHRGPYTELDRAYRALKQRFDQAGVEATGDPREIYWSDPEEVEDEADYVTEVAWPIAAEDAARFRTGRVETAA